MTTLTIAQRQCVTDALNTFESISFEMPQNPHARFELIGKWQIIRRILAEIIHSDEYFSMLENSPYQLPYEWGEKIFLTKNKKILDLLEEVLDLACNFSPALDSDSACFRVFNRMIAELANKDLNAYRLLFEKGEVVAKYCKEPI